MEKLVGLIEKAPKTRDYNDDDFVDRLSSRYTVVLLVLFALLVSMNQYVRNPITCWTPNHFTGSHNKYTTSYCWVKNTYYLPWNETVPREHQSDKKQMIPYYQWVPFILVAQAVLFYLPSLVWHGLNSRAGVDADNILAAAHTFSMTDKVETRDRTMKMLIQQLHRFLRCHDAEQHDSNDYPKNHKRCCRTCRISCCQGCCGKRIGNYLVMIFLLSKVCYLVNVIGQLFLLGKILSTKYLTFGFDLTRKLFRNEDWTEEYYVAFPRVTICDFKVRGQDMVNPHPYTIQCVLPVNMYNEKIYMFLWYWMIALAGISFFSLCIWLLRSLCARDREKFVINHVSEALEMQQRQQRLQQQQQQQMTTVTSNNKLSQQKPDNNLESCDFVETIEGSSLLDDKDFKNKIKRFSRGYLKQDGELLLRLIAHNTNHLTTTEVIHELWRNWKEYDAKRHEDEKRRDSKMPEGEADV